jgi:hypothetical protein
MTQLSRPFQIVLVAVVLFALVWFVALRGHSASPTPVAGTPASTPAPATAAKAKAPAGTTHIEGMTRAVTHAREAVAASQQAADKSASSSAEAPSQGASVTSSSATVVTQHGATHSSTTVITKHGAAGASTTVVTKHVVHTPAPHKVVKSGIPAQQAAVERELKRGEVAVILFWNKKGADDVAVHRELQYLATIHRVAKAHAKQPTIARILKLSELEFNKPIAVHYATAAQVTSFGSITHGVQVYATPTILIVNKVGQTTTLTGLQDYYSIEQTIDEARQAQS